jgi:hypothetical protein
MKTIFIKVMKSRVLRKALIIKSATKIFIKITKSSSLKKALIIKSVAKEILKTKTTMRKANAHLSTKESVADKETSITCQLVLRNQALAA